MQLTDLISIAPMLSLRSALLLITAFGLLTHLAYNKLEPRRPAASFVLLVAVPGALSTSLLPHFTHRIHALAATFSFYYLVLCSSVVAYRLSPFHPLARYPGPLLDKISMLRAAWITKGGKRFLYYDNLHQKYGDVIRIGPNEICIRNASVIGPLLGTQGLPKGPQNDGRTSNPLCPSLISLRDRDMHMNRRVLWLRGLNTAAIKGYEPIIRKRVTQLVEQISNNAGSTIDLSMALSHFAYDFMSDMAFGGGTEMLRDGDIHGLWKLQVDGTLNSAISGHLPWAIPFARTFSYFTAGLFRFRRYGMATAAKRQKEGSQTKDLFYHLIDEGGIDKEPPSLDQVIADGTLAIVAGSDTTATTISNLFCFLMSNPQVYACLQAEVDKFYPEEEDALSSKFHTDMPYLSACINETLRVLPVVPSGSQRGCMKGMGDRTIGPYFIPEGTAVSPNFYSIQRDPRNFSPAPELFWPERWLIAEKKGYAVLPPSSHHTLPLSRPKNFIHNMDAYVPFSHGPANCVGKFLALHEMKSVICSVMQKLDLRFADGYDSNKWHEDIREQVIFVRGSLPVVATRRI